MRAFLAVIASAVVLAGCAAMQQAEREKKNKELIVQSDAALADCNVKFPAGNPPTAVARRKCLNDAVQIRMPVFGPDQDLVASVMADDMVIAEKIQNGKMTMAEGNAAIAARWSQAVSEAEHRTNARNSVLAQQNAANAANAAAAASIIAATKPAPMPAPVINPTVTCMHMPGSVLTTCN